MKIWLVTHLSTLWCQFLALPDLQISSVYIQLKTFFKLPLLFKKKKYNEVNPYLPHYKAIVVKSLLHYQKTFYLALS